VAEKLFEASVIPFYHLLCRYGVALIAHGQNVTLVMKDLSRSASC
jgi:aerobactin synthase